MTAGSRELRPLGTPATAGPAIRMVKVKSTRLDGCHLLWPVYWPPHTDPEISMWAAKPHCHIAWNRLPLSRRSRLLWDTDAGPAGIGIYLDEIVSVRECRLPIISPPIAPVLSRGFQMMTWWPELLEEAACA